MGVISGRDPRTGEPFVNQIFLGITGGAGKIPFICFDLSGGANLAGSNILIGKQGGQLDFLRACTYAEDALSILVMESTAANGTISRIVPHLGRNATTGGRYETQVVVTEFGAAELRGLGTVERARALAAVAHPQFRDQLLAEAEAHR